MLALSHAIHLSHADRMKPALKYSSNVCYACHPGYQTQCLRDVHYSHNMTCNNCHGNMKKVGDVNRQPWVDLPTCKHCHQAAHPKDQFEEPGKLFKDSRGHGGVHCAACHGPQHAVMPCVTPPDNQQAINQQGFAGTIQVCTVCHKTKPGDPFFHRIDEGNRPNKQKKPGHTQHQSEKKDPNHEEKTKSDPRHEPGKDKSSTPENSKLIAKGRTEPGKNPLAQAPAAPTDSVLGTYQLTGTERAVLGRKSAVATFSGTLVPLDVGSIQVTKVYTSGRVDRAVVPLAAALNPALASQTVTGVVKSGVLVTTYTFSFTKTARGFTVVGSTAVAELVGNLRLPRAVGEGTFQGSK